MFVFSVFCYSRWLSGFERVTLNKPFSSKFSRVYMALVNPRTYSFLPVYIHVKKPGLDSVDRYPGVCLYESCTSKYSLHSGLPNVFISVIYGIVTLPPPSNKKATFIRRQRQNFLDVMIKPPPLEFLSVLHCSVSWRIHFSNDIKWVPSILWARRWILAKLN